MASPFPGMDPYLEQFWGDIHASLIIYAREQLQVVLPSGLRARVEERVFVESPDGGEQSMYPDVRVVERGRRKAVNKPSASGVAVAEPLCIRLPDEPITQGFIEIIDLATGRRVVTVIEVLSPSNKAAGPGRELYEKKRQECRAGGANLVEINLLRGGPWALGIPKHLVPLLHRTAYCICVFRAGGDPLGEFYRAPLRERLPVIKVPLRESDDDVPLDIQALVDQCYRTGGYDDDIDYGVAPDPPLSRDDASWADALLRKHRLRAPRKTARNGGNGRRKGKT